MALGLRPGDVITIFSPNCPEFAVFFLAVGAVGAVASTVNPVYTEGAVLFFVPYLSTLYYEAN